ncbi:MAG: hypothetical protein QXV61_00180 [Archaeoglobaceae archaeon]
MAKELQIDVDEIKTWSAEKIVRWSIALKLMNEEISKATKIEKKRHLFVFR